MAGVAAAPLALDVQAVAALMSGACAVSPVAALMWVAVPLALDCRRRLRSVRSGHIGGCAGHGCRGFAGHGCEAWRLRLGGWLGIACLGSVACTGSCWQWDRYLRRWINVCY